MAVEESNLRVRELVDRAQNVCQPEDFTGSDTQRIQRAIDSCQGGGTVRLQSGRTYADLGTIELKSGVTLDLNGATLVSSTDPADFWGLKCSSGPCESHRVFIGTRSGTRNVKILGPGTIKKGKGSDSWHSMVDFFGATDIEVRGASSNPADHVVIDSRDMVPMPSSGIHLNAQESQNILFEHITIRGRRDGSGNGGIMLQTASHVTVRDCDIDTNDDGVGIKPDKAGMVMEDILVEDCRITDDAGALKFGSGTAGDARNITFHNITIYNLRPVSEGGSWRNGAIQFGLIDGGSISDVTFSNITIESDVNRLLSCNSGNVAYVDDCIGQRNEGDPIGSIRNICFENFTIKGGAGNGSVFGGNLGSQVQNVKFLNINFERGSGNTPLVKFKNINGLTIANYTTNDPNHTGNANQDFRFDNVTGLTITSDTTMSCSGGSSGELPPLDTTPPSAPQNPRVRIVQ
ncbi:MAG: glycoside hydrolase family 28 protein [bacterium]